MESGFAFQLVLQLPALTNEDFDVLLTLEESLEDAFDGPLHELDGHDFGSGTGNIFIDTNDPMHAFALAKRIINLTDYPRLKAAYRSFEDDEYTLLWPENSNEEFHII